MRLRTLAGAYAGQIRDYRTDTGLAALRTGTAERVDAPTPAPRVIVEPTPAVVSTHDKRRKSK